MEFLLYKKSALVQPKRGISYVECGDLAPLFFRATRRPRDTSKSMSKKALPKS